MELTIGCTTRPLNKLSFADACKVIAGAGYTDVAVFANQGKIPVDCETPLEQVREVRTVAENAGLKPSLLIGRTHLDQGLDHAVSAYKRLIDNAAELGAEWVLDGGTSDVELYDDYYELMRRSAPHAAERGIKITLKPHGGITLDADLLLKAAREVNHPAFGLCLDPGNIIYYTKGEKRPEDDAARLAPFVTTMIIKDCKIDDGKPDVMVTPGEGLVDFQKVLGDLVNNGFRGPLYLECVGGREIDEIAANIRKTLPFVRAILEGL